MEGHGPFSTAISHHVSSVKLTGIRLPLILVGVPPGIVRRGPGKYRIEESPRLLVSRRHICIQADLGRHPRKGKPPRCRWWWHGGWQEMSAASSERGLECLSHLASPEAEVRY